MKSAHGFKASLPPLALRRSVLSAMPSFASKPARVLAISSFSWFNSNVAARVEAKALLALAGKNGDTIESLRELIAVPPEIEVLLRTYVRCHPAEGREIELGLRFRERVLEEFERMTHV
jgi:hypothetical protein